MSIKTFAVLLYLTVAALTFIGTCLLADPSGPTTIGRSYLPFAMGAWTAVSLFIAIQVAVFAEWLGDRLL